MSVWRVGGKLKRTLYKHDQLVGLVDTAEIAAEIVETMNRVGRLLDEVRAEAYPHVVATAVCGDCYQHVGVTDDGRLIHHTAAERQNSYCRGSREIADSPQPRDAQRRSEATPQNDLPGEAVECICGRRIGTGRSGRFAGHDDPATSETCAGSYQTPQGAGLGAKVLDRLAVDPYDHSKGFTPKNGEHPE